MTLNSCEEKFKSLEPTVFYYRPLKTFKENLVAPPPRNSIEFPTIKPGRKVDIKTDSNELLLMLTEPEHRIKWMKSLNNITLRDHKINRILSVHECLIGSNHIEVSIEEVTTNDLGINFFERARMKHPQLDFLVLYHIEKKNNKITSLGIGNHFYKTRYWPINLFLIPVISLMFRLFYYINLKRLNKYAEKELF